MLPKAQKTEEKIFFLLTLQVIMNCNNWGWTIVNHPLKDINYQHPLISQQIYSKKWMMNYV